MLEISSSIFAYKSSHFQFKRLSLFLAVCAILCFSCFGDELSEDRLLGKWIVVSAARNGKETKTLEDGYFDFIDESTFSTNIFSGEKEYEYVLTNDGFRQLGVNPVEYKIADSQSDSLILLTRIRSYEFLFIAIRDTIINGVEEL